MLRKPFGISIRILCLAFCLFLLFKNFAEAAESKAALAAQVPVLINMAIDNADSAAFEDLVDIKGILNSGLAFFLRDLDAMQRAGDIPPILALLFSPLATRNAAGEQARNLLIAETRSFILNGVDSGAFAGRRPNGQAAHGLLAPLFAEASVGRKEIRDIGQARMQGAEWLVPFVVHDFGNGEDYPVVGRMSLFGSKFKMTAVENLAELVQRINDERKRQE